jgi:type IV secretion system protein VirD4
MTGAGRVYWGQLLTVLLGVCLSAAIATQWTAAALGYQPGLGPAVATAGGAPLYPPWGLFVWWYHYDAYARDVFHAGGLLFLAGCSVSIGSSFAFSLWRSREVRASNTYGSARWAGLRDIRRLSLTQGDGIVLGSYNSRLLRHDGDEHVLVVAPTNTGKSVGISLPTSLIWRHSFIALDLKGEIWTVASGLRSSFGPVFRFAPAEANAHRYNPLTQVRRGVTEVRDAQALADMLVDPDGSLRERSHWQLRAFELLVAVILWTLYVENRKTLSRLADLLADPGRPVVRLFEDMLIRPIKDGAPHAVVASGARQLLDMADAERSGVVSTALGYLALYRDPILARATSVSDFDIEDFVTGPHPASLFLVVPPEDISRLRGLLRLVLNQILKRLTEIAAEQKGKGRRILLMLDEFPQLGRLDFFEHALAYIRGYRIRACLIAQSLNQIAQTYGEHSSIIDNAHVRVAFACNDERTARRLSDMLGVATETRAQMNYAGSRMAPWLGHTMVSRQEVPRPLLTPGELMQLPVTDALILTGGAPPIRARKVRYFQERVFTIRLRPACNPEPCAPDGVATTWDSLAPPPAAPAFVSSTHRSESDRRHQQAFGILPPSTGGAAPAILPGRTHGDAAQDRPTGLPFGPDDDLFNLSNR